MNNAIYVVKAIRDLKYIPLKDAIDMVHNYDNGTLSKSDKELVDKAITNSKHFVKQNEASRLNRDKADKLDELHAQIDITARLACYQVNPTNPLVVAESIKDMVELLKRIELRAIELLEKQGVHFVENERVEIRKLLNKISEVK